VLPEQFELDIDEDDDPLEYQLSSCTLMATPIFFKLPSGERGYKSSFTFPLEFHFKTLSSAVIENPTLVFEVCSID